ncbi:MAG: amidohydrolase family protein [Firmicutes bacterium]|nr:amidohydrolase family protein [Bacillota bacterium]
MAFGFFKKSISADLVLHNGNVITSDVDMPKVSAVACKGNKIVAVGEYEDVEPLINADTEIVNLEGKYLVPGFISLLDSPVMKAFEGKYADLSHCESLDQLCDSLDLWIASHPDSDIYFGYGFNEVIFEREYEDNPEAIIGFLDKCCDDKPLVLLGKNNITCLLNSYAVDFVRQTAEEEMVQYITAPYILNLLIPFDFEELENSINEQISRNNKAGITSVLNLDSPDYFDTFYQDVLVGLYNEGELKQRFFGSYYMNRPVMPSGLVHHLMNRKNTCIELDDFVNSNILYIDLDTDNCPVEFTQEILDNIAEEVADKGFDIIIKAAAYSDLEMAYMALEHIRSKGYKNIFAIQSEHLISDELSNELMYSESAYILNSITSSEFADVIGMTAKLGSIEVGKLADMAVFEEDPYTSSDKNTAHMVIIDGAVVNLNA